MSKKMMRKLAVMALLVLAGTILFGSFLTWKTVVTDWKMSELTHESSYYQSSYVTPESYAERDELVQSVDARRDELKNSSDNYVAWIANMPTLGKIGVCFALFAMTACQVYLAAKVVMFMYAQRKGYARDIYKFMCNLAYFLKTVFVAIAKAIAWTLTTLIQCITVAVLFAVGKVTGKQRVNVRVRSKKTKTPKYLKEKNEMGTIVPFRREA